MRIITKKNIGYFVIIMGVAILVYSSSIVYKMIVYPQIGEVNNAKIIDYQSISNDTKMIQSKKSLSGINPFFEFYTTNNKTIISCSNSLQFIAFFNYKIGESITVAYPKNQPNDAIILSIKELPSIIYLYILSILFIFIGNNLTLK